jgi:ferritin-like metal-binding protein YciE
MTTARDELIEWLRDAYAMERGLEVSLRKLAEQEALDGDMRERVRLHLQETRNHAEAVEKCLSQMGEETSGVKTVLAQAAEGAMGIGTAFVRDERVKDMLSGCAMEHFEIACYKAIRAAAKVAGESEIVTLCNRILPEEERMAEWFAAHLDDVVSAHLARLSPR